MRLRVQDAGEEFLVTAGTGEGVIYGLVFERGHFDVEATMEMMLAEFAHHFSKRCVFFADERDVRDGRIREPIDEGMCSGWVNDDGLWMVGITA